MSKTENSPRKTVNYKLAALEQAIVYLRRRVVCPQDASSFFLTPTMAAALLAAARLGAAEIYKNPSHLDFEYPFP